MSSTQTTNVNVRSVNVDVDAVRAIEFVFNLSRPPTLYSEENKMRKTVQFLTWAGPDEFARFQKAQRLEWYREKLQDWSSSRCSPITSKNYRKQTENTIIHHVGSYDPANAPAVQEIFLDESPVAIINTPKSKVSSQNWHHIQSRSLHEEKKKTFGKRKRINLIRVVLKDH